jgi:membrane protein
MLVSVRIGEVLKHPGAFALQVLKAFQANQGLLLAGAVAYYTLLSGVPLLILMVIGLSHVVPQGELLETVRRAMEWIIPGQSRAVVKELEFFLENREVVGGFLMVTMLFFSSLAFKVLENAFSVVFLHRVAKRRRHWAVSLMLPVGYILFITTALFIGTLTFISLVAIGEESIRVAGHTFSLDGASRFTLYVIGICAEIILLTSLYWLMPVGRMSLQHAFIGGATAGLLWEFVRRVLVWYFSSLSQVNVVYGSLTTSIVVLLMLEIAATLLLLGAQIIAEFERIEPPGDPEPVPMRTEAIPPPTSTP